MSSLLKSSIYLLLLAGSTGSCEKQTLYHSYQSLPLKGWRKNDTLFFRMPVTDSMQTLRWSVKIRNRNSYPYQNLHLIVSQNFTDSTHWKTDTLELKLADKEGKWIGIGWGSIFQSTTPWSIDSVKHTGHYTIKILHGMKDECLTGLNNIGIKMERCSGLESVSPPRIDSKKDEQQDSKSP